MLQQISEPTTTTTAVGIVVAVAAVVIVAVVAAVVAGLGWVCLSNSSSQAKFDCHLLKFAASKIFSAGDVLEERQSRKGSSREATRRAGQEREGKQREES